MIISVACRTHQDLGAKTQSHEEANSNKTPHRPKKEKQGSTSSFSLWSSLGLKHVETADAVVPLHTQVAFVYTMNWYLVLNTVVVLQVKTECRTVNGNSHTF